MNLPSLNPSLQDGIRSALSRMSFGEGKACLPPRSLPHASQTDSTILPILATLAFVASRYVARHSHSSCFRMRSPGQCSDRDAT